MNSVQLKTDQLPIFHSDWHGMRYTSDTIATKYVADTCHPKEQPYQIGTQFSLKQSSY